MGDPTSTPRRVLLDTRQAAEYLGLSAATLNRWRSERAGQGPRWLKLGGAVRYNPADLEAYVAASACSPERGGAR